MASPSPFLAPGPKTAPNTLAIISLSRNRLQPITLEQSTGVVDGYAEGATLNTRFGSFPHSTLLGIPWGSQVRASVVDTGSRGRKRRWDEAAGGDDSPTPLSTPTPTPAPTPAPTPSSLDEADDRPGPAALARAVVAPSGFVYVLRPTPELWTSCLPHRTQVVYTPDYSYILQRIRARPGSRIVEAGAGSGSFTHAAARAVYNGPQTQGKVFSFEFHEPRFQKMQDEIKHHALQGLVHMTHRDVYRDGFLVYGTSPQATAVFLDLPAPWEALHHLSRRRIQRGGKEDDSPSGPWVSPLDPEQSVYLCTFSPCIEQVTRTVAEMRTLGWTDIDMVEIAHKRFNVMRERVGVSVSHERGPHCSPADVGEAVRKLRGDMRRTKDFHKAQQLKSAEAAIHVDEQAPNGSSKPMANGHEPREASDEPAFMQGRVVHRTETELKTHTSYLVFAILPREWDAEAEAAALAKWPCGKESKVIGSLDKEARKQEKREQLTSKKKRRRVDDADAPWPAAT